jgi:tetratricopeptide (TPR) repeat protein
MKEILQIDPGNQMYQEMVAGYYLSSAEDALDMNQHRQALKFLDEGLEVCPGNAELQSFAGAVYLDMGDKPQAEAVFQKTIDVNPTETKPYIAVAHHYLDRRMMDDAKAYFAKAMELDPGNPQTYIDIASEYCSFHMCEDAQKYYEMAKKMKPRDVAILVLIVEALMEHECSEYGIQYARELVSIAPADPKSYFYLGLAYHFDDMIDEAMDTLIEGLEIAEETGNDEMISEIEGLYSHIEFTNSPFGRLLDGGIESLLDGFFDAEE